jgi:hypothetical protein
LDIIPPLQRAQNTAYADVDIFGNSDSNSEGWYPQSVESNNFDANVFELNSTAPILDTVPEQQPPASISRSTVTKNLVQTKQSRPSPTFVNPSVIAFPQEQVKGQWRVCKLNSTAPILDTVPEQQPPAKKSRSTVTKNLVQTEQSRPSPIIVNPSVLAFPQEQVKGHWPSSTNSNMVQSEKHTQSPIFDNASVVPTPNKQQQMDESLQLNNIKHSHYSEKTEENEAGAITLLELRTPRCTGTSNTATQDQPMSHVAQGNPMSHVAQGNPNSTSMITGLKPLSVAMFTTKEENEMEMSSLANEFSEKYSAKDISEFVRCLCGPGASSISSSSAAHASTDDVIKMPPSGITPYLPLNFSGLQNRRTDTVTMAGGQDRNLYPPAPKE